MKKIVIAAEIESQEQLNDLIFRLYHHFSFIKEVKFYIFKSPLFVTSEFKEPLSFGVNVTSELMKEFFKNIIYRTVKSNFDIEDVCKNAKAVIVYSENYYKLRHELFKKNTPKFYWCDPIKTRQEGSNFIQAALDCITVKVKDNDEKESLQKFLEFSGEIKNKYKEAIVLATGPSVENFKKYSMNDKLCFACNSTILNNELVVHAKPQVLVFADPIFHFGISKYAQSFRDISKKFLDDNPHVYLIIPIKYYALLKSLFPKNKNQIIGVPFTKHRPINIDITENTFYSYTTANILTLLLLPLAATLTEKINLIGCDGRSLDDNDYFWRHGKSVQINEQMSNIQECHPGFFKIDYDEYYFEHCHMLDNFILAAEIKGKQFLHLGNTHIPALAMRSINNQLILDQESNERLPLNTKHILIEPDGKSAISGHYFQWYVDLAKALQTDMNSVSVLTRIDANYINPDISYIKLFNVRSWELQRGAKARDLNFPYNNQIKLFFESLKNTIGKYFSNNTDNQALHIFMYYGSVQVVKICLELQVLFKELSIYFTICLFSESVGLNKDNPASNFHPDAKIILTEAAAKSRQFRLFSVTQKLSDVIYQLFSVKTSPMVHPLMHSDLAKKYTDSYKRSEGRNAVKDNVIIYIPSRLGHQKSNVNFFQMIEKFLKITTNVVIKLRQSEEAINFFQQLNDRSIKERLIVLPEIVDIKLYFKMLCDADIIYIPYTAEGFYARTSGVLYDSIMSKTPVIVERGTWLAEKVFHFRAGLYLFHTNAESLQSAVKRIINNYEFFSENLEYSSECLFKSENFDNLVNQILKKNINPFFN